MPDSSGSGRGPTVKPRFRRSTWALSAGRIGSMLTRGSSFRSVQASASASVRAQSNSVAFRFRPAAAARARGRGAGRRAVSVRAARTCGGARCSSGTVTAAMGCG